MQAQRSQKSGAQVSRKAPAAIVTIDWVPKSEFFQCGRFCHQEKGRTPPGVVGEEGNEDGAEKRA